MESPKCPNCSAPVPPGASYCTYCGSPLSPGVKTSSQATTELKDFGFSGKWQWTVIIIGIIAMYAWGWYLEDTESWLRREAVMVWSLALPLWTIILTALWRIRRGAIMTGFLVSILMFAAHTLIIASMEHWHFNDDYVGIAGIFSGIQLASWLIGRGIHHTIRKNISG